MNTLEVTHYFDAAHKLPDGNGLESKACARLHGHTYAVKVQLKTKKLNDVGMVVDFKAIKRVIDRLDHNYINDIFEDYGFNYSPTAENTARFITEQLESELGVKVLSCSVCEGYKGPERGGWATYTKK